MASQPAPTDENRLADENGTTMASMLPKKAIDFLNNEVSKRFKLNTGKPTLQGVVTFEIDDPVAQDNAPLEAFLVHNSKFILVSPVEQFPRSVASIRCPSCGNSKSVKIDGWTNNLRSVKDVHCEHLLKQRKYKCTQCAGANNASKTTYFNATNAEVLKQLPAHVRERYPEYISAKAAATAPFLQVMRVDAMRGKSFKDIADAFKEQYTAEICRRMRTYYSFHAQRRHGHVGGGQKTLLQSTFAPQPPKEFPSLIDKDNYKYGMSPGFLIEVYLADFEQRLDFLLRDMLTRAGSVLAGDHTFKVTKKITSVKGDRSYAGAFDLMNDYCEIVALAYVDSTAMSEVSSLLGDLYRVWEANKLPLPEYVWVDDSRAMEPVIRKMLPGIKEVLEDSTHVLRRIARSLPEAHSLQGPFMADLSKAFFKVVAEDEERMIRKLQAEGKWGAPGSEERRTAVKRLRQRCRHIIPGNKDLQERVQLVFEKYEGATCIISSRPLFTQETRELFARVFALIKDDKISDPLPVEEMFIEKPDGSFICKRGTSKLEGWHAELNGLWEGNRTSPQLAAALTLDGIHRHNVGAAARNRGKPFYGTYASWILHDLNTLAVKAGVNPPFPDLGQVPQFDVAKAFGDELKSLTVPKPALRIERDEAEHPDGAIEEDAGAFLQEINAPLEQQQSGEMLTALPQAVPHNAVQQPDANHAIPCAATASFSHSLVDINGQKLGVVAAAVENPAPSMITASTVGATCDTQVHCPMTVPQSPSASKQSAFPYGIDASIQQGSADKPVPTYAMPSTPRSPEKPLSPRNQAKSVARSPKGKRKLTPADASGPVNTEEEKELLVNIAGLDISELATNKQKRRRVAQQFNAELAKCKAEDPAGMPGATFKTERYVKDFVQRVAGDTATGASVHFLNYQQQQQQQLLQQLQLQQLQLQQVLASAGAPMFGAHLTPLASYTAFSQSLQPVGFSHQETVAKYRAKKRKQGTTMHHPVSSMQAPSAGTAASMPLALVHGGLPYLQSVPLPVNNAATATAILPAFRMPAGFGHFQHEHANLQGQSDSSRVTRTAMTKKGRGGVGTEKKCSKCGLKIKGKRYREPGSCIC